MNNNCFLENVIISNKIGYGADGNVYTCVFNGKNMVYKELTEDVYRKNLIRSNLERISTFYGDSRFAVPYKFVYNNPSDNIFTGYTMDYLSGYKKMCDLKLDYKQKIDLLMKARKLLEILHKDYKHVHTDINPWNFLYNEETDKLSLIDFDTCIDLNNGNMDYTGINTLSCIYGQYNGFDPGLDIFLFNLLTFSIINNVEFYDVINSIIENNYGIIENSKAIEIFKDYDDIEFNTLKKEYVIDYL